MNNELKKAKVLVVDDSALMRRLISDILNANPELTVVGTAGNGKIALEKLVSLEPDVITLDVEMPVMNGIETLQEIQKIRPTPVVMLSSLTKAQAEVTLMALEMGAIDFIEKPEAQMNLGNKEDEIVTKVLNAAKARHKKLQETRKIVKSFNTRSSRKQDLKTVIIGSSTGGPQALKEVVPYLSADLPAQFLIVQHMPPMFTEMFANRLNNLSNLEVVEAKENDEMSAGKVLLAPGNYHMTVDGTKIALNQEPPVWGVRPAVDITLASAAKIFKENLIFVILTGMGRDGSQGAKLVKDFGGYCIAEDESTCVVYGMPKVVIESGCADEVLPLHKIADAIVKAIYR